MSRYEKLNNIVDDNIPRHKSFKTLFNSKTDQNADSVEWCPIEGYRELFVCGNYQLIPASNEFDTKQRIGRILLYSIDSEQGLKLEDEIETAAVLDQKWCHRKINDKIILGVVNSDSELQLYELTVNDSKKFKLELLTSLKFPFEGEELLILSLDWSNNKLNSEVPEIVCSDSVGSVHVIKFVEDSLVLKSSVIKFHEFETWITGFYYWNSNIFFSGGDDCILYQYDQRCGTEPVSKNLSHQAGVTCLHSNCTQEYILASGSYDEHVRIWDIRNFKSPKSEVKTPGPLWRVKFDPFSQNHLLVASMLGGVHVLHMNNLDDPKIVDSYYDHESMAYGVDWCFLNEEEVKKFPKDGNVIVGSCSFYDNLLCVTKLDLKI